MTYEKYTYEVSWTKYGGASYIVYPEVSYEDLQEMFHELSTAKYLVNTSRVIFNRQKDILISESFPRDQVVDVMNKVKNGPCDILSENKRERFLIYNIARIFGYKTEPITKHQERLISCNEFSPEPDKKRCGCDYAPRSFWKYHRSNNYEDTVAYSLVPWTIKIGVRISWKKK